MGLQIAAPRNCGHDEQGPLARHRGGAGGADAGLPGIVTIV